MQLYAFTWDAKNGWNSGSDSYAELIEKLESHNLCQTWWSAESHRRYPAKTGKNDLEVGDKFILCRSRAPKDKAGIIGFGQISKTFYVDKHYEDLSKRMYRVELQFDGLDKDSPCISSQELSSLVGKTWNPLNHNHVNKAFGEEVAEEIWNTLINF